MKPQDVDGYISDEQGRIMQDYARKMPAASALEIGSYRGKSACYLASGMPEGANLFCVDPWEDSEKVREEQFRTSKNFDLFCENVEACGLSDRVTAIRGFSHEVAEWWGLPLGLLYIDGGHEYDEVIRDIDGFLPHVVPGGVVLFDDYSPAFPGIQKALGERFDNLQLHEVPPYNSKDKYGAPRWLAVAFV